MDYNSSRNLIALGRETEENQKRHFIQQITLKALKEADVELYLINTVCTIIS